MTPDDEKALLEIVAGLVPATAQQVGVALGKLTIRLSEITAQLAQADDEATRLTEEHDVAFDTAYLREMEQDGRLGFHSVAKATARQETRDLRLRMEVAKANVRQLDKAHRTLDRRIDVGRTQAATVRTEARTVGYGGAA